MNVAVARLDSTTIVISWEKLSQVELKGLATYVITYSVVIPSRKRQQFRGTVNVSWTENSVFISNLHPGAQYDISIGTLTSAGMSGNSCTVLIKGEYNNYISYNQLHLLGVQS